MFFFLSYLPDSVAGEVLIEKGYAEDDLPQISYAGYEKFVCAHGVELVGFTEEKIVNPGDIKTLPGLMHLFMALQSGDCHWQCLDKDEWESQKDAWQAHGGGKTRATRSDKGILRKKVAGKLVAKSSTAKSSTAKSSAVIEDSDKENDDEDMNVDNSNTTNSGMGGFVGSITSLAAIPITGPLFDGNTAAVGTTGDGAALLTIPAMGNPVNPALEALGSGHGMDFMNAFGYSNNLSNEDIQALDAFLAQDWTSGMGGGMGGIL
jgi:hypothetical protein